MARLVPHSGSENIESAVVAKQFGKQEMTVHRSGNLLCVPSEKQVIKH